MINHNDIIKILQDALDNHYQYGANDCNILVLRIIDLISGSNFESYKYTNIKEGLSILNELGYAHTGEIVLEYCQEVTHTIDGDIWLDPENPLVMAVVASNRILAVNEEHNAFELRSKPKEGRYYRVRKKDG